MLKKVLNIFNNIFLVVFSLIILMILLFNNSTVYGHYNFFLLFLILIIVAIIINILYKKVMKLEVKNIKRYAIAIFLIILTLQIICAYLFRVSPSWDFEIIYREAMDFDKTYDYSRIYFSYYPNNIFLLFIMKIIFSFFHYILGFNNGFLAIGIIFNIIMIDLAVILTYLTVKRIYDEKNALFALILLSLSSAIYLYVPIFYTDTISMLFPILLIYIYTYIIDKNTTYKNKSLLLILFIITGYIGMLLKFTIIIPIIAILIYHAMKITKPLKKYEKNFRYIIICILCLLIIITSKTIVYDKYVNPYLDKNEKLPYTHWIAMGLTGVGGYNNEDAEFAKNIKPPKVESKKEINIIKDRIENHIKKGTLIPFLNDKIIYTWGDGSYYAPSKLTRSPILTGKHQEFIKADGRYHDIFKYLSTAYSTVLLLMIVIATLYNKKKEDSINMITRIAIFGLFLFLLIWEARSRYIINFIPIIILSSLYGFKYLNTQNKIKVGRRNNEKRGTI